VNLGHYLDLWDRSLLDVAHACSDIAATHRDEPDVRIQCEKFARNTARQRELLLPFLDRYEASNRGVRSVRRQLIRDTPEGPLGLIRDLHDLCLVHCDCDICGTLIQQAAEGARDAEFADVAQDCRRAIGLQLAWLRSRMKQAAPQALVVAD
jgi:hypothetical protein